ncbi:MAG: RNA polymerase sigma-70 factor, ECF subfamily [Candidatus Peregrinibacteria bacterium Gr01-1014_25]|nr:MAG: RNA polymerase sigma-70 factor, ECF subfamily [Candidatus Peregrinibacteria bacterium Gr01-1014_25]
MPEEQRLATFTASYDAHAKAIFRHCSLRILDRDTAMDIVQETFIRLWEYMEKGHAIENVRALLYRIANNLIVDEVRRRKRRPTVSLESLEEEGFHLSHDPTSATQETIDSARIIAILGKLPPLYRDLLVMRYIDGLSPREIATITRRSPAVVSVQLNRGVRRLRVLLRHG